MPDRDTLTRPMIRVGDIRAALGLLTRLPLRLSEVDIARGAAAAWAYPLAGLVVGLIAGLVVMVAGWLGLPSAINAGLALASMVIITGALHEDGLADSADGLWGGWDPIRRLEIMKDSHIGSYGVIALILSLGLRWIALTSLAGQSGPGQISLISALVLCATLSRAPMVVVMSALPHARRGGLSVRVGRPHRASAALAVAVACGVGLVFLGLSLAGLIVVLGLVTLAVILIAKAKIGGQTGDILGATQQVSEVASLFVLASMVG